MLINIPFQMHLFFVVVGAVAWLLTIICNGLLKSFIEVLVSSHPFVMGIACYIMGFLAFYLGGHL